MKTARGVTAKCHGSPLRLSTECSAKMAGPGQDGESSCFQRGAKARAFPREASIARRPPHKAEFLPLERHRAVLHACTHALAIQTHTSDLH